MREKILFFVAEKHGIGSQEYNFIDIDDESGETDPETDPENDPEKDTKNNNESNNFAFVIIICIIVLAIIVIAGIVVFMILKRKSLWKDMNLKLDKVFIM